jgi:WhiB family transcriptional regulator, redox-sensing transcriptional regulator
VVNVQRLPAPVAEVWEWQHAGTCRGQASAMFFHPDGERGRARQTRIEGAKQVCRRCPVIVQCRQHALQVEEPFGVWGGQGEDERREAIRRRRELHRSSDPEVAVAS